MIKKIFFVAVLAAILTSCKKDDIQKPEHVTASPEQLAAENSKLSGTWAYMFGRLDFFNVSGIPSNDSYPLNGSVNFDGKSTVNLIDYSGHNTQISYFLTGVDSEFYVNVKSADSSLRKCKIILLSADSLTLQNTLIGSDTSRKLIYTEFFVKANQADITNNIFRISISPFTSTNYIFNFNVNIYITHIGGQEQLVESKISLTQAYDYTYKPNAGDQIRIALSGPGAFGPVVKCLATYRGVPYGNDWLSSGASSALDKSWTITN